MKVLYIYGKILLIKLKYYFLILLCENLYKRNRRLTNGNCSPPCSGGSGSAKHRSGYALCGILLHHILPALVLLRKPLFGLAKRQLPVTLNQL